MRLRARIRPLLTSSLILALLFHLLAVPAPAEQIVSFLTEGSSEASSGADLQEGDSSQGQSGSGDGLTDFQRGWGIVKDRVQTGGRAYWDSAASGEQISSLSGFVYGLTDTMNPLGGGIDYGPLLGQREAYLQGRQTGDLTGTVENGVLLVTGAAGVIKQTPRALAAIPGALRATPAAIRGIPGALRAAPGAIKNTVGQAWTAIRGGQGAAAAQGAQQPNRIYSTRELLRRSAEPGPYHNFPSSFDDAIFSQGSRNVRSDYFNAPRQLMSNDSINYSLPGHLNGRAGTYEIFTRPSASGNTEVIWHRFFKPAK